MVKQKNKCNEERLTRAVLLGLATTTALMSFGGTASATTLTEYKAQLAAQEAVEAGSGEKVLLKEVNGDKSSGKVIHASDGGQIFIADTPVADVASYQSTMADTVAGHWNTKSNVVVDLTNDVFFAEGEDSKITIENGTVLAKASNLYGHGETELTEIPYEDNGSSYIKRYGEKSYYDAEQGKTVEEKFLTPEYPAGIIEIGDVNEYKNWQTESNTGAYATLKLIGNTKFNNSGWTNEVGEAINNKNFIVLRKNGILEAESAQIFNFGLGDGTTISTGGVRKDANDAILFESGVVLLGDDKYNNEYLTDANIAVKAADNGNTVVEVKSTAKKVDVGTDVGSIKSEIGKSDYCLEVHEGTNYSLNNWWNLDDEYIKGYVEDGNNLHNYYWNTKHNSMRHNYVRKLYVEDGTVVKPMTVAAGFNDSYSGDVYMIHREPDSESSNLYYHDPIKELNTVVDMSNVVFKVSPVNGTYKSGNTVEETLPTRNVIEFCNGTTLVKASNLYGDEKNVINVASVPYDYESMINDHEYRVNNATEPPSATLKLIDNEKFNSIWQTDAGDIVNGKNFIVINATGTLEANSAQIFTVGLNKAGDIMSPKSIRVDADNAIYFKSGVLMLDDEKYNVDYLNEANKLVKEADGGNTEVEVKLTAVKVIGNPSAMPDSEEDNNNDTTVSKYRKQFSANGPVVLANDTPKTITVTDDVSEFRVENEVSLMRFADDTKSKGTLINVKAVALEIGNVEYNAESQSKIYGKSEAVTDLTNDVFFAESPIIFLNGTSEVKASNLYGNGWGKEVHYYMDDSNEGGFISYSLGTIEIGNVLTGGWNYSQAEAADVTATLKLVGNTKFNNHGWTNENGDIKDGKNFIVLRKNGVLEANSAQIFNYGLGAEGTITTTGGVRTDANDAILFESGVVLLDDEKYNLDYLNEANKLVKEADGGTTKVEVKPNAEKVEGNPDAVPDIKPTPTDDDNKDSVIRDIGDVPDDSWFGPVTTQNTDITISDEAGADSNADKLNAQSLDMAEPAVGNTNSITINGKQLRLGSSTPGQHLLTVGGKMPPHPVQVSVLNGGIFALGTGNAANDVYADITVGNSVGNDASQFNVMAGKKTINSLIANAGALVSIAMNTMLNVPTVTFNGATVRVDGILNITGTANFSTNSVIYVGSATSAGKMVVSGDISSLAGAAIFLDPVWKDGVEITDASQLAVGDTNIDYNLIIGRNSVASIGTDDSTKAQLAFAETQLNWGEDDITAALYLAKPVTLDGSAGLTVDGSLSSYGAPNANTATFAANSLLMVDAEALGGEAALTASSGAGTLAVDDTAKLYLANAQAGNNYTLTAGFTTTTDAKGWYTDTDNVIVNKLLKVSNTGSTAAVDKDDNSVVLKNCAIPNAVSAVVDEQVLTTNEGIEPYSTGANYVAMATSGLLKDEQSIELINTAAQAAETTGATANALGMVTTFSEAVQNQLSFMAQPQIGEMVKVQNVEKTVIRGSSFADDKKEATPVLELHMSDKDKSIKQIAREAKYETSNVESGKGRIWAKASYERGKIDGRALAGTNTIANYDNNFTGISVGYDLAPKGNYEQGIAVSYGFGSASANGVNERDKYQGGGVSYYGSIKKGDSNLIVDVGGYQVKHDVEGLLKAEPKTNLITLGITEEYRKSLGNGGMFVPHIGLRYTYIDTPAYDGVYNGKTAFRYAPEKNHVFTVPVGIGYMSQFNSGGWKYNFAADLSYIGVLGGQSANMDVTIPGLNAKDSVCYDVIDRSAVKATLGLAAENDRMKWGVNYSFKGSSNEKSHRVSAGISWKF
ncbi:autotransporter outer membrane beta-barrel domain-containing protein [Selenomonas sp. FC4001]|uniref:autotransporter family protein n=1 Tax=Selenomonas sp. FC4001 TaxID=1408313 RepID=UPI0005690D7A|nr:autotransporter outer membrane beta-barrel domain-containing protein [Selenomonas sp. FC4001]